MNADVSIAFVPCDAIGCENGLVVDARHLRNFEGRDWACQEHEETHR